MAETPIRGRWTITTCTECGALTEDDRDYGGPLPINRDDCPRDCGTFMHASSSNPGTLIYCPGEREVEVVPAPRRPAATIRLFWARSDPTPSRLVLWRGNGGVVDWEREYVPVPDEAAIERAAEELAAQVVVRWQDASESVRNIYRDKAREILRAALDPDAPPETPGERHHRELHDGTLNEMPPETRHA